MTEKEFTELVQPLREAALMMANYYHLGAEETEDIAQDTMLKLWAIKMDIHSAKHAKGLAIQIAKHLIIDQYRKKKTVSLDALPPYIIYNERNAPPDSTIEEEEDERWLQQKLKTLPSNQYQVVHLSQVERKSNEEIAIILGITPGSVATLLSRARKTLLAAIKKRQR